MANRTYSHTVRRGRPVVVRIPGKGSLDEPMAVKSFGLLDTLRELTRKS